MSLEQCVDMDYWSNRLDEKDNDIQTLAEELEEIRFLFERKTLEYDDLRRLNYEL